MKESKIRCRVFKVFDAVVVVSAQGRLRCKSLVPVRRVKHITA